jgi:drug/metabolite transporter (DMT)-like permease
MEIIVFFRRGCKGGAAVPRGKGPRRARGRGGGPAGGREPNPGGGCLQPLSRRAAVAGLVVINLVWAGGYPAAAVALRAISAAPLTLLRLAVGAAMLAPWLRLPGGARWRLRPALLAAALGALGFALPIYLQTAGLARSSAAMTAVLVALEPLLTAGLGAVLLRQTLPARRRAGLAVAAAGAWLIAGLPRPGHAGFLLGDALLVLSVLCFAGYNVLSAALTAEVPPGAAAAATMWAGFLAMVPVWLLAGAHVPRHVGPGPAGAAAFLAVAATGLAYVVWVAALGSVPAAEAALYLYLQPVGGVLLAVWITGTRPGASFWAGAALVLLGVFLGTERPARPGPASR